MSDGSIVINTAIDTDGLKTGLSTINSSLKRLGNNMANTFNSARINNGISNMTASLTRLAGVVGVAFSLKALFDFGKESIEIASDIIEVDNVVQKAFGDMRGEMDDLANTAIKTLGMSRLTAYQTGSTFMSMGRQMLDSAEDAKVMALELTKLTGNMASFYNKSQDLVSIALKSVYTGETETLKQYGIVMTEVNLKQFALEQGITKSYSAMSQSEKVMLRYNYIMKQTAFIGDDFTDTIDSWANQTRILKEQWKEFMSIVGNALISVLTPVVNTINSIVSSLISMASALTSVLASMGIVIQSTTNASSATSSASDAMNDYSDAIGGASKTAKKALAPFDELNTIMQSSGSGGSAGGSGINIDVEQTIDSTNQVQDAISDMFKSWYDLGEKASQKIEDLLKDIPWDEIESKFRKLGENIAEFVNGFVSNLGSAEQIGKSIAGVLNSAVNFVYGYVSKLDWQQVGRWLGTLVEAGVLDFEWELLGETIALKLNGVAKMIIGFFEEFEPQDLANGISSMFNKAVDTVDANLIGESLGTLLWNGFDLLDGIFSKSHFAGAVSKVVTVINKVFTHVEKNKTLGTKVGETIATILNTGFDLVLHGDITELISSITSFLFDAFNNAIKNIDAQALKASLEKIIIGIPMEVANSLSREITITLLSPFLSDEDIANMRERMSTAEKTAESFKEDMQKLLHVDDSNARESTQILNDYNKALLELRDSSKFTAEGLAELQDKYNLPNEYMTKLIDGQKLLYTETQLANKGLADYNGNWELFNNKTSTASQNQEKVYYNTERMNKVFSESTKSIDGSNNSTSKLTESTKEYIKITDSIGEKSSLSNELSNVKDKTEGVTIAFEGLSTETQKSLDDISTNVNTWFEETIQPIFSQETWAEFGENINTAMADTLTVFMESWTEQFTIWGEDNLENYFGYDLWYTMLDENILTAYRDIFTLFSDEWTTNMTTWQTEFVEPYFTEEVWKKYGENMKKGIVGGFKAIVSEVGGIMGKLVDVFNSQMSKVAEAVNELIGKVNNLASELNISSLSSVSWSNIPKVSIPALATGAVLPANKPFLSIVGDQKNGTNIEAPLDTIKQAMNEVLRGSFSSNQSGDVYISADGDLDALVRLLKFKIEDEGNRVGRTFTKVSTT